MKTYPLPLIYCECEIVKNSRYPDDTGITADIAVYQIIFYMSMLNDKSAFKFHIARLDTDEYDSIRLTDSLMEEKQKI